MTGPSEPVAVPELVDRIAAGRPVVAGWENGPQRERSGTVCAGYRLAWDEDNPPAG